MPAFLDVALGFAPQVQPRNILGLVEEDFEARLIEPGLQLLRVGLAVAMAIGDEKIVPEYIVDRSPEKSISILFFPHSRHDYSQTIT